MCVQTSASRCGGTRCGPADLFLGARKHFKYSSYVRTDVLHVRVSESAAGKRPHRKTGRRQNGLRRVVFPLLVVVACLNVLSYEPSSPLFDHFVEVSGSVDCCSSEFAYLFPYVLFLCFS